MKVLVSVHYIGIVFIRIERVIYFGAETESYKNKIKGVLQ